MDLIGQKLMCVLMKVIAWREKMKMGESLSIFLVKFKKFNSCGEE